MPYRGDQEGKPLSTGDSAFKRVSRGEVKPFRLLNGTLPCACAVYQKEYNRYRQSEHAFALQVHNLFRLGRLKPRTMSDTGCVSHGRLTPLSIVGTIQQQKHSLTRVRFEHQSISGTAAEMQKWPLRSRHLHQLQCPRRHSLRPQPSSLC